MVNQGFTRCSNSQVNLNRTGFPICEEAKYLKIISFDGISMKKKFENVYQFKITMLGIQPPIWRRIQVPETYSFWDLHVAIQDSIGWQDHHLHEFQIPIKGDRKPLRIGIPSEDDLTYGWTILPGYKQNISDRFTMKSKKAVYIYDFGDGWAHEVLLEGILTKDDTIEYPICIAGERACPPEDCGGVSGYAEIIRILQKGAKNRDDKVFLEWLGDYDSEEFDPKKVKFDDPKKRYKMAFS